MKQDKDAINAFRALFIFTIIIVSCFTFWGILNPPSKKAYNPQKAYSSHQVTDGRFAPPPNIDPDTKGENEPTEQQIEQWRADRSDLAAQWETADMAHLAFRMGILGMLLLGWTIFETKNAANFASSTVDEAKKTTRAAEDSVKVTREIGEAQSRAYLSCMSARYAINDTSVACHVRLKNSGTSPAVQICIVGEVSLSYWEVIDGDVRANPRTVSSQKIITPYAPLESGGDREVYQTFNFVRDFENPDFSKRFRDERILQMANEGSFSLDVYWLDVFGKWSVVNIVSRFSIDVKPVNQPRMEVYRGKLRFNQSDFRIDTQAPYKKVTNRISRHKSWFKNLFFMLSSHTRTEELGNWCVCYIRSVRAL